jgi:hypothetical protein
LKLTLKFANINPADNRGRSYFPAVSGEKFCLCKKNSNFKQKDIIEKIISQFRDTGKWRIITKAEKGEMMKISITYCNK